MTNRRKWFESISTIGLSMVGGVVFYLLWMLIAIPISQFENIVLTTILWLLAPLLTALGFASGAYVAERKFFEDGNDFKRIFVWSLVGCTIGAITTYIFGPMLIVFGMLALGAASMTLREIFRVFEIANLR